MLKVNTLMTIGWSLVWFMFLLVGSIIIVTGFELIGVNEFKDRPRVLVFGLCIGYMASFLPRLFNKILE